MNQYMRHASLHGLPVLLMLTGCDTINWERGVYDTLENKRQMECQKVNTPDCGERQSYDKYQRQRNESGQ